jgi:hypothetical protein
MTTKHKSIFKVTCYVCEYTGPAMASVVPPGTLVYCAMCDTWMETTRLDEESMTIGTRPQPMAGMEA